MAIVTWIRFAVLLVGWLAASAAPAADISVRVSRDSLAQNETLQLILEMRGTSDSAPDISPLYQDFEILWRSQSQSTRTVNGKVQRRASLTLTLRPKRAGLLEIPAISAGGDATRPIRIEVQEAAAGAAEPAPGQPPRMPFEQSPGFGQPGFPPFQGYGPGQMPGTDLGGGMPGLMPPGLPMTLPPPLITQDPPTTVDPWTDQEWESRLPEADVLATPPVAIERSPDWLTWGLGLAWLATVVAWWWSVRRRRRAPRRPPVPTASKPAVAREPEPLESPGTKILAVRAAYEAKDTVAARDAFLDWAHDIWRRDTPNNLSRLARLCPGALGGAILRLDEALYNPKSSDWWRQPVWEWMADFKKPDE